MIKVMWFLKRADHLSLEEFHKWWTDVHAPMIVKAQSPRLKKYVINLRWADDTLSDKPSSEIDWDGCAEQWFETEGDFEAIYGVPTPEPMRSDTMIHVSRNARMVVRENAISVSDAPRP